MSCRTVVESVSIRKDGDHQFQKVQTCKTHQDTMNSWNSKEFAKMSETVIVKVHQSYHYLGVLTHSMCILCKSQEDFINTHSWSDKCRATLASPHPVRSGIDVRGGCHLNFFGPWILTRQRFHLSLDRSGHQNH